MTPTERPSAVVYRVSEVAALLDMGARQTRESLIRGEIPGHKLGSQWRVSKRAFKRWLRRGGANGLEIAGTKQARTGATPSEPTRSAVA